MEEVLRSVIDVFVKYGAENVKLREIDKCNCNSCDLSLNILTALFSVLNLCTDTPCRFCFS